MMNTLIIKTEDNISISANHYDQNRDKVVIVCPGCFMCKEAKPFLGMSDDLHKKFDIITMDFRGHGKSSGLFTFTANEYKDLKAVVDLAKRKYKKIGLLGFSLGAATSIIYASLYKDVDSIVAVSAPTDFDKIENRFWDKKAVIPAIEKFELGKNPTIKPGNILLDKIKPIEVVAKISSRPILFLTGDKDPIIYPWHSEKLFEQAGDQKEIEIFPNGLHAEELYIRSKKKFIHSINEWFRKTIGDKVCQNKN